MRNIFRQPYNLDRDIAGLRESIHAISELRGTVSTPGWKQIRALFENEIAALVQGYMSLCDNPKKNEIEIKCKRMVSESLGRILGSIDATIASSKGLEQGLEQRLNDAPKKQELF